jgi:hypothetical protein
VAAWDKVVSLDRFDASAWIWTISCVKGLFVPSSLPVLDEQQPGF